MDVADKEQRALLVKLIREKYAGKLDVLVPNVAVFTHFGNQLDISEEKYDRLWNVNVKSTFFLIAETIDLIREAGPGSNICIISSVAGKSPTRYLECTEQQKLLLTIWLYG